MNADQKEKFKHLLDPLNITNYNLEQLKAKQAREKTVQQWQQKIIKNWTKVQEEARGLKGG